MTEEKTKAPRRFVSVSQLSEAARCPKSWILTRIFGQRDTEKSTSAILGTIVHQSVGAHIEGRSVYQPHFNALHAAEQEQWIAAQHAKGEDGDAAFADLLKRAPRIALPVVGQLPQVPLNWITVESRAEIKRTLAHVYPEAAEAGRLPWDLEPMSALDLMVDPLDNCEPLLADIKTTKDWSYMPSPEKMAVDLQKNMYVVSCADRWDFDDYDLVPWKWIYTITTGKPLAKVLTGHTSRREALSHLMRPLDRHGEYAGAEGRSWFQLAEQLVQWRADAAALKATPVNKLPISPLAGCGDRQLDPCQAFGGCKRHVNRGGQCNPFAGRANGGVIPLSSLLGRQPTPKKATEEPKTMLNPELLKRINANRDAASAFRPPEHKAIETTAEPVVETKAAPSVDAPIEVRRPSPDTIIASVATEVAETMAELKESVAAAASASVSATASPWRQDAAATKAAAEAPAKAPRKPRTPKAVSDVDPSRVGDLQKRLDEKDAEIAELKKLNDDAAKAIGEFMSRPDPANAAPVALTPDMGPRLILASVVETTRLAAVSIYHLASASERNTNDVLALTDLSAALARFLDHTEGTITFDAK